MLDINEEYNNVMQSVISKYDRLYGLHFSSHSFRWNHLFDNSCKLLRLVERKDSLMRGRGFIPTEEFIKEYIKKYYGKSLTTNITFRVEGLKKFELDLEREIKEEQEKIQNPRG